MKLHEVINFHGDQLFEGAVNVDWFFTDQEKRKQAARNFLFHGPKYHGVSEADIGDTYGHTLTDTATVTKEIVQMCYGDLLQPFTLAVAGYGAGKSHLAVTIASLLNNPSDKEAVEIMQNLRSADGNLADEMKALLSEGEHKPALVIAINGMRNFDLTSEIISQLKQQVKNHNESISIFDAIRPRFKRAENQVNFLRENDKYREELLAKCGAESVDEIIEQLQEHNEVTYSNVFEYFEDIGMSIQVSGVESLDKALEVLSAEYIGENKPFSHLLILFDEFGRYAEFAATRSSVAGSGVLQQLFEGVQANSKSVSLVGFIQYDLSAYVQRVAPEHRSEIQRYVSRYDSAAKKIYLSTNLETLIAHLLEKIDDRIPHEYLDSDLTYEETDEKLENLHNWYPYSKEHRIWREKEDFHNIIVKGCWPLSPYAMWVLYYFSAAGKLLQERSVIALLGNVISRYSDREVDEKNFFSLSPVDLWSEELKNELILSEEQGQTGRITHSYSSVEDRHAAQFSTEQKRILQAIVLMSKTAIVSADFEDALLAITEISGLPLHTVREELELLEKEYNVLDWGESTNQFNILGDAVPRTQFLQYLRNLVFSSYDEQAKAELFINYGVEVCSDIVAGNCDFAESNSISTREWAYEPSGSATQYLDDKFHLAAKKWINQLGPRETRGTVIYCYVGPSEDIEETENISKKIARKYSREFGYDLPIIAVLLHDESGELGNALAQQQVLEQDIDEEHRIQFGGLIDSHLQKVKKTIASQVAAMLKQRHYATSPTETLQSKRLQQVGSELFARIYPKTIPFPFDGFGTRAGNADKTCFDLTLKLFREHTDYDAIINLPVKEKNRAIAVLEKSWGIFNKQTGEIVKRPQFSRLRSIFARWDEILSSDEKSFVIHDKLLQLCQPPYGCNLASAGLIMGVYIAGRFGNLVIYNGNQQYEIAQFITAEMFKGKHIDLSKLGGSELLLIGESSNQWENLLEDWNETIQYRQQVEFWQKAEYLKERSPLPPALQYKYIHLKEKAENAAIELKKMEEAQEEAFRKLQNGLDRGNPRILLSAARKVKKTIDHIDNNPSFWSPEEKDKLQDSLIEAGNAIPNYFDDWLKQQEPRGYGMEDISSFQHFMKQEIASQLDTLSLGSLAEKARNYTTQYLKEIETHQEARQLISQVENWLTQNQAADHLRKVSQIRDLRTQAKNFSAKLRGMASRVEIEKVNDLRLQVSQYLTRLKDKEEELCKRAKKMWNSNIKEFGDIEILLNETDQLIPAFEGIDADIEDLFAMKHSLRLYQEAYKKLSDENLIWQDFESLCKQIKKHTNQQLADEELPWDSNEVLDHFIEHITKYRNRESLEWIQHIEDKISGLDHFSVKEANDLRSKIENPPPTLTESHNARREKALRKIYDHLGKLEIEWLTERYHNLDEKGKKQFLRTILPSMDIDKIETCKT